MLRPIRKGGISVGFVNIPVSPYSTRAASEEILAARYLQGGADNAAALYGRGG